MSLATVFRTKALSAIVVWILAASLLAGIGGWLATPVAAQNCDRSGGPTAGDWTIGAGDNQVCENIVIVMDGDLIIQGAGSLTIRNGGLKFVEDTAHVYSISVAAGGTLAFEDSKLWTETNLINPYMQLSVTVSGTLTLDNSVFAFPGTVSTAAGATVRVENGSVIRSTESDVLAIFTSGPARDDNDDAPGLTFTSSTVSFFASRVEDLYENTSAGFLGDPRQHIRLEGTTTFTAADTFLAIDFCCTTAAVDTHNTLDLAGTSDAFLYGVTTDDTENPGTQDQWVSAIVTAQGTWATVYRWAEVSVVDANGVPVAGATVTPWFSGPETGLANYTEGGNVPPAIVYTYLGKTAGTWDETDAAGRARMPLASDWIDTSTMPDSRFVGTFQLDADLGADTGTASLTFPAYPLMDAASASSPITIQITTLTQPLPDLTPTPPTFVPAVPKAGETVQITAPVLNQGAGAAANILVRVFDGTTQLTEQTIPFIAPGTSQSVPATLANATAGQHVIRVSVDPDGDIIEGPGALAELNNLKGYQLSVTDLGPDLAVDVSFNPDPGFLNNPVELVAGVTNVGDRNATSVRVNFYVQVDQPTASSTPVGTATIPFVDVTATASVNWTPTALGSFIVWAWADPLNAIPEPAPYSEADNLNSNTLVVGPAPDLVTLVQDLTLTDPFPRVNQAATIEAVVRNSGQAATGGFRVDFTVDGIPVGFRTNAVGLAEGRTWVVPPLAISPFLTCGQHTIGIDVDSLDQVAEGALYETNNLVTTTIQVYPDQVLAWNSGGTITADQAFSSSIEIGSSVSISGAEIRIVQDQDACGRYYVKVLNGGSLTLTNAELTSNWPLVVFVAGGGTLTATGSTFTLDVQGKGVLSSKGTIDVRGSTVVGDLIAKGTRADLRGDVFRGSLFYVDAAQTTRIWDATMPGVSTIQLLSDQTGAAAVDFDIRNVTFNSALTAQLVFSGDQYVQLTSVDLTRPGDWWTGMLTQSAHVRRYWWLTVEAVDGTGTPIRDPTTAVDLRRFNPATLAWDALPPCAADECYFQSNNTWLVGVPTGILLYRAAAEDRYGSSPPSVQATYLSTGWADIEGSVRQPDADVSALVDADTTITLVFSELTPDLQVVTIAFNGDNGAGVTSQPIGRSMNIVATVLNAGEIITRDVVVNFYATDVDINRDGYMDNPHAFYNSSGLFIGQAGPLNVSALASVGFIRPWTPPGTLEGSRTVSAVADPSTGSDPRAGGAIPELSESNNTRASTVTIFTWPDLHLASNPVVSIDPLTPIANNAVTLEVEVSNEGTNTAVSARIGLYNATTNASLGGGTVTFTLGRDASAQIPLAWLPASAGLQTIRIRVEAAGAVYPSSEFRNWDFALLDNYADVTFDVQTQPDLTITQDGPAPRPFRNSGFLLNVTASNTGQTGAPGIAIKVWEATDPTKILGFLYDVDIPALGNVSVGVPVSGISVLDAHTLVAKVDANNSIQEPNEGNNEVQIVVTVLAPQGRVVSQNPSPNQVFQPGVRPSVTGTVISTAGPGIPGVDLEVRLERAQVTLASANGTTDDDGRYIIGLSLPANLANGAYTIVVEAPGNSAIERATISVRVERQVGILDQTFAGIPVWVWLIVIVGVAIAAGGGTAYVKFVGLGKLVECGECGAYITEDSTKCPKCGVEFEKDMAKCSNCQAWIPVDVKQCPECGVEFLTGEVEMADYEAQMRKQYDEVKRKFREEASRELGRAMTDREFDDWWRTQPTFVTFEDWLREEEEMRRMGSKPCPSCSTLNSVTATVCHKCGTLLKEDAKRPGRPAPGAARPAPAAQPARPPAGMAPEGEEAAGVAPPGEAIPKKVVKKPVVGVPVVQKKVIKRPLEEEKKEGEGGEGTGGEEEQI